MNIRAVGENPNAAASVGVSVLKIKYTAIAYSGLMAGFGGAFMSCPTHRAEPRHGRRTRLHRARGAGDGAPANASRYALESGLRLCAGARHQVLGKRTRFEPRLADSLRGHDHSVWSSSRSSAEAVSKSSTQRLSCKASQRFRPAGEIKWKSCCPAALPTGNIHIASQVWNFVPPAQNYARSRRRQPLC